MGIKRTIDPDIANKILLLWMSGYTPQNIASYLRVSRQAVMKIASVTSLPMSTPDTPLPDRSNRKIRQLYKRGYQVQEIANDLALDIDIVQTVINK